MSGGELARRTLLQSSSVYRAVRELEAIGVVAFVGVGRRSLIELRRAHPMVPALEALFAAERRWSDAILTRLRKGALALVPPPIAVWIEGPIAFGADRPGDGIEIIVLVDDERTVIDAVNAMWHAIDSVERELDIRLDVHGIIRGDVAAYGSARQRGVVVLAGVPPFPAAHAPGAE